MADIIYAYLKNYSVPQLEHSKIQFIFNKLQFHKVIKYEYIHCIQVAPAARLSLAHRRAIMVQTNR